MAATCGVTFNSAVATGINMLGDHHGGAVEGFMDCRPDLADPALATTRDVALLDSWWPASASDASLCPVSATSSTTATHAALAWSSCWKRPWPAGVIRGTYLASALALEAALAEEVGREIPLNVDGLTGIVYLELGFPPAVAKGLFSLSRGAGIVAHALEERLERRSDQGALPARRRAGSLRRRAPRRLHRNPRRADASNRARILVDLRRGGHLRVLGPQPRRSRALDPLTRRRLIGFTNDVASGAEEDRESLLAEISAGLAEGDRADALRRLVAT